MLKFLLATIISLSVSVREPRQVPTAPFDYELSYKIENNIKLKGKELPNQQIIIKEDYNQITSKDIYQFNSDIRYQFYGISAGYGVVWDLKDTYTFAPSIGLTKTIQFGNWQMETENDIYFTDDITYQTEGQITYNVSKNVGLGLSGNYIKTLDNYDYMAKVILTIKLTK